MNTGPAITTAQDLTRTILDRYPQMLGAGTLEMALWLRAWVSETLAMSARELVFDPVDAVSATRAFHRRTGGVWAAGAARYYALVLNLFGIPAATYSYCDGRGLGLGHDTTLVFDTRNRQVYLLDAYLHYHYADAQDGRILPFDELLSLVAMERYEAVAVRENPVERPYLTLPGDRVWNRWLFSSHGEMQARLDATSPAVWVYRGAHPSLSALVHTPGLLREVLDRCRGDLPVEHFMLRLLLTSRASTRLFLPPNTDPSALKTFFFIPAHASQGH